jgi:altronate hydrolase
MSEKLLTISDKDNVSVVLEEDGSIPFGHKIASEDIRKGEQIIKYGYPIGHASCDIKKGDHVHVHNLKTNLNGHVEYEYQPDLDGIAHFSTNKTTRSFMGYEREDKKVGIRNEVWIIPTVGCVNTTAELLAKRASEKYKDILNDSIDGIFAYTHNMGCSQLGEDHRCTQQILKGLIDHPNAGAVLVLSLGCENNNLDEFKPILGNTNPQRVKFLVTQELEDELEAGEALLDELILYASQSKRTKVPASKLIVGFKCGGSDAFSGITANPLCGKVNDKIVNEGGSTVLTEVPEMFGAEQILMARAIDESVFKKTVELINNFKGYFTKYGQTIYENPSPGNKKGGISSLEEKSLGCIQKGGTAPVVDVLNMGEPVVKNGLSLLNGPGNDQVSVTNLVASGAQMVLFTTGRGNPFGTAVPTVKISSNTQLYNKKRNWIDFNAGAILDGVTLEEVTEQFLNYLLDVASGSKTKNEQNGYREISIFRDGVIL